MTHPGRRQPAGTRHHQASRVDEPLRRPPNASPARSIRPGAPPTIHQISRKPATPKPTRWIPDKRALRKQGSALGEAWRRGGPPRGWWRPSPARPRQPIRGQRAAPVAWSPSRERAPMPARIVVRAAAAGRGWPGAGGASAAPPDRQRPKQHGHGEQEGEGGVHAGGAGKPPSHRRWPRPGGIGRMPGQSAENARQLGQ